MLHYYRFPVIYLHGFFYLFRRRRAVDSQIIININNTVRVIGGNKLLGFFFYV